MLAGRSILIVEDDPLLALDLAAIVEDAGGNVVGPALNVTSALRLVESEQISAAVLDVRLFSGVSQPVAERLESRGIPFLYQTGHGEELRRQGGSAPVLDKPVAAQKLVSVLAEIIERTARPEPDA